MKTRAGISFFLLFAFSSTLCVAGPFGFDYGMSKQDVVKIVGKNAIVEDDGDMLTLSTAPKPHGDFDKYLLIISPEKGLLKIVAVGIDIDTSGDGTQLKDEFEKLRTALSANYGQPEHDFDFLHAGSIWTDDQDWMMGLLKQDRSLASYWDANPALRPNFEGIALEAKALSSDKGYVVLSYEFDGWGRYADQRQAQKDKVL
ncbi:MAG: hypothetical protein WDM87_14475 [Terracidiphilus sp.]